MDHDGTVANGLDRTVVEHDVTGGGRPDLDAEGIGPGMR